MRLSSRRINTRLSSVYSNITKNNISSSLVPSFLLFYTLLKTRLPVDFFSTFRLASLICFLFLFFFSCSKHTKFFSCLLTFSVFALVLSLFFFWHLSDCLDQLSVSLSGFTGLTFRCPFLFNSFFPHIYICIARNELLVFSAFNVFVCVVVEYHCFVLLKKIFINVFQHFLHTNCSIALKLVVMLSSSLLFVIIYTPSFVSCTSF